jgi:hypothetical protein
MRSDVDAVLARLVSGLGPGDILLAHDGHAARTADGIAVVVATLPALLDRVDALGLTAVTLPEAARADDAPTRPPAS